MRVDKRDAAGAPDRRGTGMSEEGSTAAVRGWGGREVQGILHTSDSRDGSARCRIWRAKAICAPLQPGTRKPLGGRPPGWLRDQSPDGQIGVARRIMSEQLGRRALEAATSRPPHQFDGEVWKGIGHHPVMIGILRIGQWAHYGHEASFHSSYLRFCTASWFHCRASSRFAISTMTAWEASCCLPARTAASYSLQQVWYRASTSR